MTPVIPAHAGIYARAEIPGKPGMTSIQRIAR